MADPQFSEEERRTIASIFFTIFDKLSLEEMRSLLGNRIGKSTINRDKQGLRERAAPSSASAAAYAAALGYGDTLKPDDSNFMRMVVDRAVSARRSFFDAQPLLRRFTSARHPYPAKTMARLFRAIDERRWDSVIDIIETFREGDTADKHASVAPYFEFYLGLSHRNLGDMTNALTHFRAAYEMIPEGTNEERDFLSHAAANYALALQDSAGPLPEPKVLDHLLSLAVGCMPENFPDVLVNAFVVASRMPNEYLGVTAERIASKVRTMREADEIERIRATFMEQIELRDLRDDDMFQYVIAALDKQVAKVKGA